MTAPQVHPGNVTVTIDGRQIKANAGSYVLGVARGAGIDIPSLCDYPDLEPVAACRVCMVQVSHPDWNGWSRLVTACAYPVVDGLQVQTRSEAALRARQRVISLMLARCPQAQPVIELARQYGATTGGLQVREDGDKCILCGLCTRVCESFATAAITTISRGNTKAVGSMGERPDDCIGCGGCALVCPTGHITSERTDKSFNIWNRVFFTHVCEVDSGKCIGCGTCQQSCPFSVARVVLVSGGQRAAVIPGEHCRGCGACAGACPSGAIDQRQYTWQSLTSAAAGGGES